MTPEERAARQAQLVADRLARIDAAQEARAARIAAQNHNFNAHYTTGNGFNSGNSGHRNRLLGFIPVNLQGATRDLRIIQNFGIQGARTLGTGQAIIAGDVNGLERDRWRGQRYRVTAQANMAEIQAIQSGQRLDQVRNGEVPVGPQGGAPFRGGVPAASGAAPVAPVSPVEPNNAQTFRARVEPMGNALAALLQAQTPEQRTNALNYFTQLANQNGVDTPIPTPMRRRGQDPFHFAFNDYGGTMVQFSGESITPRQLAEQGLANRPDVLQLVNSAIGAAPAAAGQGAARTTVADPRMVGIAVAELSERINANAANREREGQEALGALRSMGFQNVNDRVTIAQPLNIDVAGRTIAIPANTYTAQEFTGLVSQQVRGLAQAPAAAAPAVSRSGGGTPPAGGGAPAAGGGAPAAPAAGGGAAPAAAPAASTEVPAFPAPSATRARPYPPLRGGFMPPIAENQVEPLQARMAAASDTYRTVLTTPPPRDPDGIDGKFGFRTAATVAQVATAAGVDVRQLDFTATQRNEATTRFLAYVDTQIAQRRTQTPTQVQVGPAVAMVPAQNPALAGTEYDAARLAATPEPQRRQLAIRTLRALDELRTTDSNPSAGDMLDKMRESVRYSNENLGTNIPADEEHFTRADTYSVPAMQALGGRYAHVTGLDANIYRQPGQTQEAMNTAAVRGLRDGLDRRVDDPQAAIRQFERRDMQRSAAEADGLADPAMNTALDQALRERGGLTRNVSGGADVAETQTASTVQGDPAFRAITQTRQP